MKIYIREACGYVDLETETANDLYLIGRIAQKFDVASSTFDAGKRRVELPLEKVVEQLAE